MTRKIWECFGNAGNILFLDYTSVYMEEFSSWTSIDVHLQLVHFLYVSYTLVKKIKTIKN
jgi:hypothetical protein